MTSNFKYAPISALQRGPVEDILKGKLPWYTGKELKDANKKIQQLEAEVNNLRDALNTKDNELRNGIENKNNQIDKLEVDIKNINQKLQSLREVLSDRT